jgi:hypothetical protein
MTAVDQMNHPNLVVVHFNSYAGGKFWINCLSHHAQVIPGLCVAVPKHDVDLWLLDDLGPEEIQRRKIDRINYSLPPADDLMNWCKYELGCDQFWGCELNALLTEEHTIPHTSIQLLDRYRCFIVNHQVDDITCRMIFDKLYNARHVVLNNATGFQSLSMTIKQPQPCELTYHVARDLDAFVVDVDDTYMNTPRTIERVKDCLQYLGLSTELDPNIDSFVRRYFDLHQ